MKYKMSCLFFTRVPLFINEILQEKEQREEEMRRTAFGLNNQIQQSTSSIYPTNVSYRVRQKASIRPSNVDPWKNYPWKPPRQARLISGVYGS
ncbi:hypothetical protein K0M31_007499 [Melipona bicolor]|uniref:Uncharacterized protein n=1 Tax=Melipona bicolor TaxID=60889 RepID=A0AA40GBL5_9HYME|nr:hypothetical protein K0M31_007499 [Melipona bicolor]